MIKKRKFNITNSEIIHYRLINAVVAVCAITFMYIFCTKQNIPLDFTRANLYHGHLG